MNSIVRLLVLCLFVIFSAAGHADEPSTGARRFYAAVFGIVFAENGDVKQLRLLKVVDPRKGQGPADSLKMSGAASVMIVTADFAQKHAKAVEGFGKAMREAEAIAQNPAHFGAMLKIAQDTFKINAPNGDQVLEVSLRNSMPSFRYDVVPAALQHAAEYMHRDAFDVAALRFEPTELAERLWAMEMNTEDSLREYLRLFVRIPLVGRIGPLARTFDFVADAAPGVKEILAVGKLCYEVREEHYDLVVVDAEASGHIVAQIGAPSAIRQLVQVGLVRDQTNWMIEILDDPVRTGLVVVTTPEEMPVTETLELIDRVRAETGVDVAGVVANRVLPALFSEREAEVFERLRAEAPRAVLAGRAGAQVDTVFEASALVEARRRVGAGHLDRLRRAIGAEVPVLIAPELFTRATGRRVVTLMAQSLHDELV